MSAWHKRFPDASDFLAKCRESVKDPGYLVNPFGRIRHFPPTMLNRLVGGMEREAQNYMIQSTVGDAMSVALINLVDYRKIKPHLRYKILLSIHDAVLLECPVDQVAEVCSEVIPFCMETALDIPDSNLKYTVDPPDISTHWKGKTPPEKLLQMGVPKEYCGFPDGE